MAVGFGARRTADGWRFLEIRVYHVTRGLLARVGLERFPPLVRGAIGQCSVLSFYPKGVQLLRDLAPG
jgi:hypothetical protein